VSQEATGGEASSFLCQEKERQNARVSRAGTTSHYVQPRHRPTGRLDGGLSASDRRVAKPGRLGWPRLACIQNETMNCVWMAVPVEPAR